MDLRIALRRSLLIALGFIVMTFPILVIRVNTATDTVEWHWMRLVVIGVGTFLASIAWNLYQGGRERAARARRRFGGGMKPPTGGSKDWIDRLLGVVGLSRATFRKRSVAIPLVSVILIGAVAFPLLTSLYQTSIMVSALIYVMLALGLNIVIGLGGMLHLGYAAFYAIGAYSYALLNQYFGISFWVALPIGALLSAVFGILLAIPVLRLRGDYLAIVTLGFAEIIRLVLVNWGDLTGGPAGIKNIPRPGIIGLDLNMSGALTLTYFICLALVVLTVFLVNRFENSRIGRQLVAMREDDIAARAMGVDIVKAKLTAFAVGALWAGLAGVLFAAKTTFINPSAFEVWESVLILSMVVLGGMGSIPGVIVGALLLSLLPEWMRSLSEYRMLLFGAIMVIMVVFKPAGLIPKRRRLYKLRSDTAGQPDGGEPSGAAAATETGPSSGGAE
ncbi:MAG: ABC transporter permease subunit [Spirochaetota bacterium]